MTKLSTVFAEYPFYRGTRIDVLLFFVVLAYCAEPLLLEVHRRIAHTL
ncbi:hypothetical protein [Anaerotignum sp.]|nr:hypothetical protein [Anaerotignum sp.]